MSSFFKITGFGLANCKKDESNFVRTKLYNELLHKYEDMLLHCAELESEISTLTNIVEDSGVDADELVKLYNE